MPVLPRTQWLLLTTFGAWPQKSQTLRVYRNRLDTPAHWIGVRLCSRRPGISPIGATVTLGAGGRHISRPVLTGDSHRAQHSASVHFGLGTVAQPDRLEVHWPDQTVTVLDRPSSDRWHRLSCGRSYW